MRVASSPMSWHGASTCTTARTPSIGANARARALVVASAVLLVIGLAIVWLAIDSRAAAATARFYVLLTVIAVAPLLFAAYRLGRTNDPLGPAVAALASATVLGAGLFLAMRIVAANSGYTFYFVVALFLPPLVRATIVAVPLMVTLVLQLASAIGAWRAIDRPVVRLGADGLVTLGIVVGAAVAIRSDTFTGVRVAPYSTTTVQHELLHVYDCLWRQAPRFPARVDGCLAPSAAPGSTAYGSGYTLDYRVRPAGFGVLTTDVGHRDAESFWLDESGALRRSVGTPATSGSPIWNAAGCQLVTRLARELDDFRSKHPSIGYPDRITAMGWPPDTTDDGVFRTTAFGHRDTVTVRADGATEIRTWDGRLVAYRPMRGGYTMSVAAADSLLAAHDSSLISDAHLDLLRSYFRDSEGRIHVTGALRAATLSDPVVSPIDCG